MGPTIGDVYAWVAKNEAKVHKIRGQEEYDNGYEDGIKDASCQSLIDDAYSRGWDDAMKSVEIGG